MYTADAYNSLPALGLAAKAVDNNAKKHLFGAIRQLFLDNNAHKKYGIALLHKHFPINHNQRLVECYYTLTAWKIGQTTADAVEKYEAFVVPRSFKRFDGQVVPYEFEYSSSKPEFDDRFQRDALDLLGSLALDGVFGLRYLGEYNSELSLEITEGNSNIMMPRGAVPDSSVIEALWVFGPRDNDRCYCREVCFKTSDGHNSDHSCG